MDLSSIVNNALSQTYAGQTTASGQASRSMVDPVTAALGKASSRLEGRLESTRVQLSAFGQIKSAFAEFQSRAKGLADLKPAATADDLKKAVGSFVDTYNNANKVLGATTRGQGSETAALADDARARIAGNNLRRAVSQGNTLSELRRLGVTQSADGSLVLDTKAIENALNAAPEQVRSTLARVGSQADQIATRELADTGHVGGSVNTLSNRSRSLEAQHASETAQSAAAQRLVDQQLARVNVSNVFGTEIAAYLRIFSS